jgi:hypothetical protein
MPKSLEQLRIAIKGGGRVDERPQIDIGFDAARTHHRRASRQHRRFCGIAANRRDERQPVESLMQGNA